MIRYLLLALNVTALLLVIGSQLAAGDRQLPFRIGACTCDNGCFTDEVRDLSCSPSGISFKSDGLPDPSHVLMRGITATNQQYPRKHAYEIHIPSDPRPARTPVKTEPGPLGVAINGIPMFDPGTQGPIDHGTCRTSHAGRRRTRRMRRSCRAWRRLPLPYRPEMPDRRSRAEPCGGEAPAHRLRQ